MALYGDDPLLTGKEALAEPFRAWPSWLMRAADITRNGRISTAGLATYLNRRVPILTDGKQTPGMEVRFDTTVFEVGQ